jgi:subtilisin family serine protease
MTAALAMPWAPRARQYVLPGSVVLKLSPGEAPEMIPARVDVRLRASHPATKVDGGPIDRLIRRYANGAQVTRVFAAAASLGQKGRQHLGFGPLEHVCGLSRTFRLDMAPGSPVESLADALAQLATVEFATPHYVAAIPFEHRVDAPDQTEAWAPHAQVHAPEALAYEPGDGAVIVGLVDSGVARRHAELAGRYRAGYDTVQLGSSDFTVGVELLGDSAKPDTKPIDDYVGHGMGCAGIIAARGMRIPPGLAGECELLPLRVLGAARLPNKEAAVGIGAIADIDCGLKMAMDLGAKVLNLSFGTADQGLEPGAPKPHADVVRYGRERGCVMVAASGNSGHEEVFWPAGFEDVIAVGAVGPDNRPTTFTTTGAHVACSAPGERVVTAALEGYQVATGTSFAAPFVAAAAGLLVSRAQRRSFPLDGVQVRQLLTSTTTPFGGAPATGSGSGVLNAYAALQALDRLIDSEQADDDGPSEEVPDG